MKKYLLCGIILMSIFAAGCAKEKPIGGEKDEHGCLPTAGYQWCETTQKCQRFWEEPCEPKDSLLTLEEAMDIAQNSECTEQGTLTDMYIYNADTETWWIDLDMKEEFKKEYCNPACVVIEKTKTAEINWRCMGALPP